MENNETIISRMISLDNIPMIKFITSSDIRKGIRARTREEMPSSITSITNIMKNFFEKVKEEHIKTIQKASKVSITMDEWSSKSRRYLNVNVHTSQSATICLGLIQIEGSATSDNIYSLLLEKLSEYRLSIDKVIASTNDGASVMTKIGKNSNFQMHLCIAHGIHLAVLKTFFDLDEIPGEPVTIETQQDEGADEDSAEYFEFFLSDNSGKFSCNSLLDKIRSIFRQMKKSPTKNSYIQQFIVRKFGKTLEPVLDCRTRWNSTVNMVERFLLIRESIEECGIFDIQFKPDEIDFLESLKSSLSLVEKISTKLCAQKSNLLQCEILIDYLINNLEKIGSHIALSLAKNVSYEYRKRRTLSTEILCFLTEMKAKLPSGNRANFYKQPERDSVKQLIGKMNLQVENQSHTTELNPIAAIDNIENILSTVMDSQSPANELGVDAEYDQFVKSGHLGPILTELKNCLELIKPTSTDCERIFSTCSTIYTKFRSSMSHDTINVIISLQRFFINLVK